MTTIVYRDGVLAADTQMTTGDLKAYGRKLIRVGKACSDTGYFGAHGWAHGCPQELTQRL